MNTKIEIERPILEPFIYKSGYEFTVMDLGADTGVTLSLQDDNEGEAKILLPKEKVKEFICWLSGTLGQQMPEIKSRKDTFRAKRGFQHKDKV